LTPLPLATPADSTHSGQPAVHAGSGTWLVPHIV
jgi:hypothetical protein